MGKWCSPFSTPLGYQNVHTYPLIVFVLGLGDRVEEAAISSTHSTHLLRHLHKATRRLEHAYARLHSHSRRTDAADDDDDLFWDCASSSWCLPIVEQLVRLLRFTSRCHRLTMLDNYGSRRDVRTPLHHDDDAGHSLNACLRGHAVFQALVHMLAALLVVSKRHRLRHLHHHQHHRVTPYNVHRRLPPSASIESTSSSSSSASTSPSEEEQEQEEEGALMATYSVTQSSFYATFDEAFADMGGTAVLLNYLSDKEFIADSILIARSHSVLRIERKANKKNKKKCHRHAPLYCLHSIMLVVERVQRAMSSERALLADIVCDVLDLIGHNDKNNSPSSSDDDDDDSLVLAAYAVLLDHVADEAIECLPSLTRVIRTLVARLNRATTGTQLFVASHLRLHRRHRCHVVVAVDLIDTLRLLTRLTRNTRVLAQLVTEHGVADKLRVLVINERDRHSADVVEQATRALLHLSVVSRSARGDAAAALMTMMTYDVTGGSGSGSGSGGTSRLAAAVGACDAQVRCAVGKRLVAYAGTRKVTCLLSANQRSVAADNERVAYAECLYEWLDESRRRHWTSTAVNASNDFSANANWTSGGGSGSASQQQQRRRRQQQQQQRGRSRRYMIMIGYDETAASWQLAKHIQTLLRMSKKMFDVWLGGEQRDTVHRTSMSARLDAVHRCDCILLSISLFFAKNAEKKTNFFVMFGLVALEL